MDQNNSLPPYAQGLASPQVITAGRRVQMGQHLCCKRLYKGEEGNLTVYC